MRSKINLTKQIFGFSLVSLLMQACTAVPVPVPVPVPATKTTTETPMPRNQPAQPSIYVPPSYSVDAIKEIRETEYAKKLAALNVRNPIRDAHNEAAKENRYLWIYQSGRGGKTKAPGLTEAQLASNVSCPLRRIDGLGDTIYGDTHLKYRVAIRKYANQFNQTMLKYCR